jgi:hypothetical protein
MKIVEQSQWTLFKNLIRPLPVQDRKDRGSGDLLSRSLVHAGTRDGADYKGGVVVRRRPNPNSSLSNIRWRPMGHIYREAKSTSCQNRLGLGFIFPYLTDLEPKSPKIKTAKGSCAPARRGTGFWWLCEMEIACTVLHERNKCGILFSTLTSPLQSLLLFLLLRK